MTDRELLQQALDALIETMRLVGDYGWVLMREDKDRGHAYKTIEMLRTRLAQPEPEPMVWINKDEIRYLLATKQNGGKDWKSNLGLIPEEGDVPLYTAPPKKEWGGVMTDKQPEALRLADEADHRDFGLDPEPTWIKNAAAELRRLHEELEKALKEKNT